MLLSVLVAQQHCRKQLIYTLLEQVQQSLSVQAQLQQAQHLEQAAQVLVLVQVLLQPHEGQHLTFHLKLKLQFHILLRKPFHQNQVHQSMRLNMKYIIQILILKLIMIPTVMFLSHQCLSQKQNHL